MAIRLRRATFVRIAVVAAGFALPLFAVGTAQAAIAGANPGTTTDRPDLVSATIVSGSEVEACFDKTVSEATLTPDGFYLDGYAAGNDEYSSGTTAVDALNNKCVDVEFSSSAIGDIDQYTVLGVDAGTAQYASTSLYNYADSTTLVGSTTHNGTAGLTIAPNLTGILTPNSTNIADNSLVFEFDKAVDASDVGSDEFAMWDAAGYACENAGASVVPNTSGEDVLVTFPVSCFSVTQAIEGELFDYELAAASDTTAYASMQTIPLPSAGLPTYAPWLVSATLDPTNPDAIDYTFNKNVVVENGSNFCFSDSTGADGETCATESDVTNLSPTVVQATFDGDLSAQQEYAVQAEVYYYNEYGGNDCAVYENVDPAEYCDFDQSTKIGGNVGAFARGFTTGADVTGVTYNTTTQQATVDLDQRLCVVPNCSAATPVNVSDIDAYQSFGTAAGVNPTQYSVNNPDQGAGPQSVTLQFPSGTLKTGTMIQFEGCIDYDYAFEATLFAGYSAQTCDPYNVSQIDEPVGSAAMLKAYRTAKTDRSKAHTTRRERAIEKAIKFHNSHKTAKSLKAYKAKQARKAKKTRRAKH